MTLFTEKAPWIMSKLMADFDLTVDESAAIVGNLGWESAGFTKLQEQKPLAGRGGYGWAQWTGDRREDYEAYCKRNKLDPASDAANYAWLYVELKGTEKKAIPAVKAADSLYAKVKAFELAFERAHPKYKHYEGRMEYARQALAAFKPSIPVQTPVPPAPTVANDIRDAGAVGTAITVVTGGAYLGWGWFIAAIVLAGAGYVAWRYRDFLKAKFNAWRGA